MSRRRLLQVCCAVLVVCSSARAQSGKPQPVMTQPSPTQVAAAKAHYAPYAFLIGDWDSTPTAGSDAAIHQSFAWGPGQSYISYTTYTRPNAQTPESVHFDGIMVWNAAHQTLDFLFANEPGSGAQEQGIVHAEADGRVVRETTMTQGNGAVRHFRQTFWQTGPNAAVTSLMRQTATGGWEPNFPGAEKIVMVRRPT